MLSYQETGVAWVPWRIQQLLYLYPHEIRVALAGRNAKHQVCYGLDNPLLEAGTAVQAIERYQQNEEESDGELPDILHLHHLWVAGKQLDEVRARFPTVRVLVTSHGEPDRSRLRRGAPIGLPPDAIHVVSADLLRLLPDSIPTHYVPNHPSRIEPVVREGDPKLRLYVPHSNVPQWKNWTERDLVACKVMEAGGEVFCESSIESNERVLQMLSEYDFVWVQLQGYAPDLLTLEAWTHGCIPIVLVPDAEQLGQQDEFFGARPPYLFASKDPDDIVRAMQSCKERESQYGPSFMREHWSLFHAASRYAQLYRSVSSI